MSEGLGGSEVDGPKGGFGCGVLLNHFLRGRSSEDSFDIQESGVYNATRSRTSLVWQTLCSCQGVGACLVVEDVLWKHLWASVLMSFSSSCKWSAAFTPCLLALHFSCLFDRGSWLASKLECWGGGCGRVLVVAKRWFESAAFPFLAEWTTNNSGGEFFGWGLCPCFKNQFRCPVTSISVRVFPPPRPLCSTMRAGWRKGAGGMIHRLRVRRTPRVSESAWWVGWLYGPPPLNFPCSLSNGLIGWPRDRQLKRNSFTLE